MILNKLEYEASEKIYEELESNGTLERGAALSLDEAIRVFGNDVRHKKLCALKMIYGGKREVAKKVTEGEFLSDPHNQYGSAWANEVAYGRRYLKEAGEMESEQKKI